MYIPHVLPFSDQDGVVSSPSLVPGSHEWNEYRKTGIGASEVGSILGVSPFKSPVDVWLEKMGRVQPFAGNNATYWGSLLEDLVAKEYAKKVGLKVRRFNYTLRRGVLIADIDRLVHVDGTLPAVADRVVTQRAMDAKTARDRSLWADGIPMHCEAQGLCYMAVMPTVELYDFACLFMSERDLGVFPLERDDAAIGEILERIEAWWERHIVGQTAPDPLSEDDCKKLWGRHRPATVCLSTPDVDDALDEIALAKQRIADAEKDEEAARMVVLSAMQDNEVLKSADGAKVLATWKSNKDSVKVDWEAVARELPSSPDLFAAVVKNHTTVKPGARVFRAKETV